MNNFNINKKFISRSLAIISLLAVYLSLNLSWALAWFWRTLNNINSLWVKDPYTFSYGYGYWDKGWGYWYGYWYGYNSKDLYTYATRAEYLKFVLVSRNIDYSDADVSKISFEDVKKDSWVAKVVATAVKFELIDWTNKKFYPNSYISRAEAIKILLKSSNVEVKDIIKSDFTDVTWWAVKYVQKAKELWIVNGQEKNGKLIFRPNDNITRAETQKIVWKTISSK